MATGRGVSRLLYVISKPVQGTKRSISYEVMRALVVIMFAYPGNVSNLTMVHVHHGKAFQEDCGAQHQGKSFSNIGAHYQNGLTEQVIGILSSCKAQVINN